MEARQLGSQLRLWLSFGDQRRFLSLESGPFLIGRDELCGLRIERPFVSRVHARLVRAGLDIVLADQSTNGTFVRMEDERVVFVHRKRVRLWGSGYLSFGEPLTAASIVQFRHAD